MDKKYTVDDILLEIKSRKSRDKGVSPATGQGEDGDFPARSGRVSGIAFAPEPKGEDAFSSRASSDKEDAGRGETLPFGFPGEEREPEASRAEEVVFHAPQKRSNPLDFESFSRPITERAKIRQSRYDDIAKRRKLEETAVVDFSSFKQSAAGDYSDQDINNINNNIDINSAGENTRVLPAVSDLARVKAKSKIDDEEDDFQSRFDPVLDKPSVDFSEYNSALDRRDVAIDIARTKLWLVIRASLTFILTAILFYLVINGAFIFGFSLPGFLDPIESKGNYLLAMTIAAVMTALVNSSATGGGLLSLIRMKANSDSLASLAMLAAIGQCVYCALKPEEIDVGSLTFYCALASLSMLFNGLGKLSMISRIQTNFKTISSDRQKRVVTLAAEESFLREYLQGSPRRPAIAVSAPCEFFSDFLSLSYSDKYDVGINRVVAPICLCCALVAGGLGYILNHGNAYGAICAIAGILSVAATFSATFIENVPLSKLTGKLAPRGGMVSGNKAVEDFCDITAVTLDENDLFPKSSVQITGIKAFAQGRVDEAILDAATIACHMEMAMSDAFLGMVGGNKGLLRRAENASFETGRGMTAWLDGRRVMLGNQKMMNTAGISIPEADVATVLEQGVLYLASEGEVTARFVVGYQIDETLALELDRLSAMEKLLIIHAVDPNLTPHKIWEVYGYPQELVRVMNSDQHEIYKKMTAPRESELAEIACTGRASAMVGALLACVQARGSILAATVLQLIQITLGYGAIALLSFIGAADQATVLVISAYQLFWFVIIWLTQKLKAA